MWPVGGVASRGSAFRTCYRSRGRYRGGGVTCKQSHMCLLTGVYYTFMRGYNIMQVHKKSVEKFISVKTKLAMCQHLQSADSY